MKAIKPLKRKNYGSIPHLSDSYPSAGDHYIHLGQERILTTQFRDKNDYLYVTEKYDGTNVGILKLNGELIALQRKGYRCEDSFFEMHKVFAYRF